MNTIILMFLLTKSTRPKPPVFVPVCYTNPYKCGQIRDFVGRGPRK